MIRRPPRSTLFLSTTLFRSLCCRSNELLRARPYRRVTVVDEKDRKSTRLNSSHLVSSYAVFCLKKKNHTQGRRSADRAIHRTAVVRTRSRRLVAESAS